MVTTLQQASTRPHGLARYQLDGCRCYECGWARSEYELRRSKLIAYGRWQPFTDIEPVRDHLVTLAALGYGRRTLARLTGLSANTIREIQACVSADRGRGRRALTRVRTTTAAAVLAVPTTHQHLADGALVPADLTWSRIRALGAAGYSRRWIAHHAGVGAIHLDHDRVTARYARKIEHLYEHVGLRLGPSTRARNAGRRNGWPTPLDLEEDTAPIEAPPAPSRPGRRRPWIAAVGST